jgi:hypothetical protein
MLTAGGCDRTQTPYRNHGLRLAPGSLTAEETPAILIILSNVVSQEFGAFAFGPAALCADMERKVKQLPHSTFGYVQDDNVNAGN